MGFNSGFKGLISAVDGVGVQRHAPANLPPGKKPGTNYTEGRLVTKIYSEVLTGFPLLYFRTTT